MNTSIIVTPLTREPYADIVKKILARNVKRDEYEIIFIGYRTSGFSQVVVNQEPLIRIFYDGILPRHDSINRINSAVAAAHCDKIYLWPGLTFLKKQYKDMPVDVVDPFYYLMLWLAFAGIPSGNGTKMKFKANLKDTLRFMYRLDEVPWEVKLWYLGWLLRAIGRRIIGRLS